MEHLNEVAKFIECPAWPVEPKGPVGDLLAETSMKKRRPIR
jgi:hypothetical protein